MRHYAAPLVINEVGPQVLVEARPNGGMVTELDATDIANNQFALVKNAYVKNDSTQRRYGSTLLAPTKPDSDSVISIASFKSFDGAQRLLRFTPTSVHYRTASTWVQVTGNPLHGGVTDRTNVVSTNDRCFFTNNGADRIQEINFTSSTYSPLGNAPPFKFLVPFYNRLVGLYRTDAINSPIYMGWSGDGNFGEWNQLNDVSAGSTLLTDSSSSFSDFGTGLAAFANSLVITKEHSIWMATKNPVAAFPFLLQIAVPNIGCDIPGSVQAIPNGIAFFSYHNKMVYAYDVSQAQQGTEPVRIGFPVSRAIYSMITNPETVFSGYNHLEREYALCIPSDSSTLVTIWIYNFITNSWRKEEYERVTCFDTINYNANYTSIDDLVGTIDSLVGTIDSLSGVSVVPTTMMGRSDGDIQYPDATADTDAGTTFSTELESKNYRTPADDNHIAELQLTVTPLKTGSVTVSYSKDNGLNYTNYKSITFVSGDLGKRKLLKFKQNIRGRQYRWKITATNGLWDLIEYNFKFYVATESRQ